MSRRKTQTTKEWTREAKERTPTNEACTAQVKAQAFISTDNEMEAIFLSRTNHFQNVPFRPFTRLRYDCVFKMIHFGSRLRKHPFSQIVYGVFV